MGDAKSTRLMRHGLSIRYDERHDEAIATYPTTHHVMVFDGATGAVSNMLDTRTVGLRYPAGVTFLPDGRHYAVTGHWENMFVFERGTHKLVRELCLYPVFFGHSHITAAMVHQRKRCPKALFKWPVNRGYALTPGLVFSLVIRMM